MVRQKYFAGFFVVRFNRIGTKYVSGEFNGQPLRQVEKYRPE